MNRRNALKISAGALAAGGLGVVVLTTAFKPDKAQSASPQYIKLTNGETDWKYISLNPDNTAELAYRIYPEGSCMYGVFSSIISQLAERFGEPFASFPTHMMKYGHGGVGGTGTICGALNGAAAVMGLFIDDKKTRDILTTELFRWHESAALPAYEPDEPAMDFNPPGSASNSVLCHASTTRWVKTSGYKIDSKERKERCRRLTADVAARTVEILNAAFENGHTTGYHNEETVDGCMVCHGSEGKLINTSAKMNCTSCHTESLPHKIFADSHYKIMKKQ